MILYLIQNVNNAILQKAYFRHSVNSVVDLCNVWGTGSQYLFSGVTTLKAHWNCFALTKYRI